MAIQPRYADAIVDGSKRVEFRKRRLAADISLVLMYATSPVQRVIGWFEVDGTAVDAPETIWDTYGDVGVIDRDAFDHYFLSWSAAVAIKVGVSVRFAVPLTLAEIATSFVPQSVVYLELHPMLEERLQAAAGSIGSEVIGRGETTTLW